MSNPSHHGNLGSSSIDPLEAIEITRSELQLLFELDSVFDQGRNLYVIDRAVRESVQSSDGVRFAAFADEPPW